MSALLKLYRGSESLINTLFSSDYEVFGAFFYEKNEMVKYRQKLLKTIILPESGRDVIELLVK